MSPWGSLASQLLLLGESRVKVKEPVSKNKAGYTGKGGCIWEGLREGMNMIRTSHGMLKELILKKQRQVQWYWRKNTKVVLWPPATCTHMYKCTHTHVYMHTYEHTCANVPPLVYTLTHVYIPLTMQYIHVQIYTAYVCMYTYEHIHVHTRMYNLKNVKS